MVQTLFILYVTALYASVLWAGYALGSLLIPRIFGMSVLRMYLRGRQIVAMVKPRRATAFRNVAYYLGGKPCVEGPQANSRRVAIWLCVLSGLIGLAVAGFLFTLVWMIGAVVLNTSAAALSGLPWPTREIARVMREVQPIGFAIGVFVFAMFYYMQLVGSMKKVLYDKIGGNEYELIDPEPGDVEMYLLQLVMRRRQLKRKRPKIELYYHMRLADFYVSHESIDLCTSTARYMAAMGKPYDAIYLWRELTFKRIDLHAQMMVEGIHDVLYSRTPPAPWQWDYALELADMARQYDLSNSAVLGARGALLVAMDRDPDEARRQLNDCLAYTTSDLEKWSATAWLAKLSARQGDAAYARKLLDGMPGEKRLREALGTLETDRILLVRRGAEEQMAATPATAPSGP
ncbi:hypothetical protein DB346_15085 [Verrucomicrobia bacterium LW23]|nr:hypothetical protein DB346_15085 [Verrucomicrobia bacterium LW23]